MDCIRTVLSAPTTLHLPPKSCPKEENSHIRLTHFALNAAVQKASGMSFLLRLLPSRNDEDRKTTRETIAQGRPTCAMCSALLTITCPTDTHFFQYRFDVFIEIDQSFRSLRSDCRRIVTREIQVEREGMSEWVYYIYFATQKARMQRAVIREENWEECRGVLLDQAYRIRTVARVEVEFSCAGSGTV